MKRRKQDKSNTSKSSEESADEPKPSKKHEKRRKKNYKSFSARSWDEVRKLLLIRGVSHGDIFPDIQLSDLTDMINEVLTIWKKRCNFIEFPGENENECEDFVKDLIISVLPLGGNLAYKLRYPVKTEEFGGPMDIAIYATTPSRMPVVYIVEAKKHNIDQGRAQLYPQLKVCYEEAKKEEKWDHPIYGVISTVNQWVFVKYDGNEWLEARSLMIASFDDRQGVEKVVEALFKILNYQNQQVQQVVAKYIKTKSTKQ
jgi:hypothetical protein